MIRFDLGRVSRVLVYAILTVFVVNVAFEFLPVPSFLGDSLVRAFVDSRAESSFVTWLSSVMWTGAALLMLAIAGVRDGRSEVHHRWWYAFALVPLTIGIDEVAAVHERLSPALRSLFDLDGALYFGWVLPVGALALIAGVVFFRFLMGLEPWLRFQIVVAGVIAGGAGIGLEVAESLILRAEAFDGQVYMLIATSIVQEFGEMMGALILLRALALHLGRLSTPLRILLVTQERSWRAAEVGRPGFARVVHEIGGRSRSGQR